MASNLVIVAIPSQDDDVWKVSSEKAPHLTVLFLGDAFSNPNVNKIVDYVKQQASRLEPFSLRVDHRATFGADEADVLIFSKEIPWQLVDFRETLKYNQEIMTAYNSVQQFPDWNPHLTLGYPETPAHPDDWDPMVTQYVTFDKVAVWYGDSEGSEFALTPNPKPDMPPEVAAWADQVGDILAHHGVKGMKWGVRKAKSGAKATGRAIGDTVFELDNHNDFVKNDIVFKANKAVKADVEKINAKPEYQAAGTHKLGTRLKHPLNKTTRKYRREVKDAYIKRLEEQANKYTNSSKTRQYTLQDAYGDRGTDVKTTWNWTLVSQPVRHADAASTLITVTPIEDDNGFIVDFKTDVKTTELKQAAIQQAGLDALEHYGVKGMRWGRRKSEGTSAVEVTPRGKKLKAKGGEGHQPSEDAIKTAAAKQKAKKSGVHTLSNEELQQAINRMNLESNFKQGNAKQASAGKKFVANLLVNTGKSQAQLLANQAASQAVKKAMASR